MHVRVNAIAPGWIDTPMNERHARRPDGTFDLDKQPRLRGEARQAALADGDPRRARRHRVRRAVPRVARGQVRHRHRHAPQRRLDDAVVTHSRGFGVKNRPSTTPLSTPKLQWTRTLSRGSCRGAARGCATSRCSRRAGGRCRAAMRAAAPSARAGPTGRRARPSRRATGRAAPAVGLFTISRLANTPPGVSSDAISA